MKDVKNLKLKIFLAVLTVFLLAGLPVFSDGIYEKLETEKYPLVVENIEAPKSTSTSTTTTTTVEKTASQSGAARIQNDMNSLARLYKYLDDQYLWDIDYDAVYDAMATAMFDALGDKYTYYVTADEAKDYEEDNLGTYAGIGFYLSKTYLEYQDPEDPSTIYCNIQQVFPSSPAAYGGLKAGDMITHIDGESVIELDGTECSKRIKGEIGTTVTLTILRGSATFEQTFTRAKVDVPAVVSTMIENTDIGYIKILQFYQKTADDTKAAIEKLLSEGMKSLVIDLRDCPGGVVDSSLAIADMFVASTKLLTVEYKDSSNNYEMWASSNLLVDPSMKVAVVVNENSASSSEILAATLKDTGRATIVGAQTYGKGIMQAISTYGKADTSVTIATFIPPSGKAIHEVGVEPDILVPSLVVTEEMADAYVEMLNSTNAEDFVDLHSEYTIENVDLFVRENPNTGLSAEILQAIVQTEYYSRMTYDEQPVCDTWFDSQLRAAIEFLQEDK
ncbi:MAG: S41 family peptidase [Sphaerochaetaceae bacterium]|nr:S41 family peptidase [Sphaerochaetaceae bacterium]